MPTAPNRALAMGYPKKMVLPNIIAYRWARRFSSSGVNAAESLLLTSAVKER